MKKVIIALSLGMLIGSATTAIAATSETVQATIAKFVIKVNGTEKTLQTSPIVVDGNSYLPVREVAGLLGAEVGYDDATRTITLQTPVPAGNIEGKGSVPAVESNEWIELQKLLTDHEVRPIYRAGGTAEFFKDGVLIFSFKEIDTADRGIRSIKLIYPENKTVTINHGNDGIIKFKRSELIDFKLLTQ
ncbi:copper amine oxidase N-terminal domain-containing protein [Paenibacillus filicis]|uniref:Copper amine oxidase N-terminal domain-containing protein n=1 Tax=Paenibacillus filicis TaxID=669464 RepID=A0ABU9DXC8_9BACL